MATEITERLITDEEVEGITGMSRYQRNYLTKKGVFPSPVKVSYRKIAYFEDEIRAWLDTRRQARAIQQETPWTAESGVTA